MLASLQISAAVSVESLVVSKEEATGTQAAEQGRRVSDAPPGQGNPYPGESGSDPRRNHGGGWGDPKEGGRRVLGKSGFRGPVLGSRAGPVGFTTVS